MADKIVMDVATNIIYVGNNCVSRFISFYYPNDDLTNVFNGNFKPTKIDMKTYKYYFKGTLRDGYAAYLQANIDFYNEFNTYLSTNNNNDNPVIDGMKHQLSTDDYYKNLNAFVSTNKRFAKETCFMVIYENDRGFLCVNDGKMTDPIRNGQIQRLPHTSIHLHQQYDNIMELHYTEDIAGRHLPLTGANKQWELAKSTTYPYYKLSASQQKAYEKQSTHDQKAREDGLLLLNISNYISGSSGGMSMNIQDPASKSKAHYSTPVVPELPNLFTPYKAELTSVPKLPDKAELTSVPELPDKAELTSVPELPNLEDDEYIQSEVTSIHAYILSPAQFFECIFKDKKEQTAVSDTGKIVHDRPVFMPRYNENGQLEIIIPVANSGGAGHNKLTKSKLVPIVIGFMITIMCTLLH